MRPARRTWQLVRKPLPLQRACNMKVKYAHGPCCKSLIAASKIIYPSSTRGPLDPVNLDFLCLSRRSHERSGTNFSQHCVMSAYQYPVHRCHPGGHPIIPRLKERSFTMREPLGIHGTRRKLRFDHLLSLPSLGTVKIQPAAARGQSSDCTTPPQIHPRLFTNPPKINTKIPVERVRRIFGGGHFRKMAPRPCDSMGSMPYAAMCWWGASSSATSRIIRCRKR